MSGSQDPPRDGEVAARSADGGGGPHPHRSPPAPSTPALRAAVPSSGLTMPRMAKDRPGDDPTRNSVPGRILDWLHVDRADAPLILAFPHGGTAFPDPFDHGLVSRDLAMKDTDWHIRQLYEGLADATTVATDVSRTIIDCNRDPDGHSLYPGQATTGLCPTTTFDGEPLYLADATIDVAARRAAYFDPYHDALAGEIGRLRRLHERVVVFDCHSIRSVVPRLFDGELPAFNVGTDGGATCAADLEVAVIAACADSGRSHVSNGRFRGGWTTRHYGRPETGVHAIQLEIAQRAYLDEAAPDVWRDDLADRLRPTLARILQACLDFAA